MSVGILFDNEIAIPPGINSLDDFRRWARSDEFPETGRIDYIRGTIEVDSMAERRWSHSAVKLAVLRRLTERVLDYDIGEIHADQMRVSSPAADLSSEPDVLILLHETIESGGVEFVPSADGSDDVEVVGGPDVVIEFVSPNSVNKDTRHLPAAYFDAGVKEFWLIDARSELVFTLFRRGESGFVETPADADGFVESAVLGHRYRLDRERGRRNEWRYELKEEPRA